MRAGSSSSFAAGEAAVAQPGAAGAAEGPEAVHRGDVAGALGHRRAAQLVLPRLEGERRDPRDVPPRPRGQGQEQRHRGLGLGLEQVDEGVVLLERVHHLGDELAARRRRQPAIGGHRQPARLDRPHPAQRVEVDGIEPVVAVAVLDQRVADRVGLAVVEEAQRRARPEPQRRRERLPHRRERELDVVVADEHRQGVAALDEPSQRPEHRPVALDDALEQPPRPLGVLLERGPGDRLVLLGQEVDEVAVDHQLGARRARAGRLCRQRLDEAGERVALRADAEAAVRGAGARGAAQVQIRDHVDQVLSHARSRFLPARAPRHGDSGNCIAGTAACGRLGRPQLGLRARAGWPRVGPGSAPGRPWAWPSAAVGRGDMMAPAVFDQRRRARTPGTFAGRVPITALHASHKRGVHGPDRDA